VVTSGLVISLLLHGLGAAHAGDATGATVNILWRAPSTQSVAIQKELDFDGSVTPDRTTQVDARSPALIYILVGIVSVDILIKTLLTAYKDIEYGGITISRGGDGKLHIGNDKKLPGGTIVVDQGGQNIKVLNARSQPGSEELLQAVTPLLK
jgi:hypothetical protein